MALFVLGFALLLPTVTEARHAVPLGGDGGRGGLRLLVPRACLARRDGGRLGGWSRRGASRGRRGGPATVMIAAGRARRHLGADPAPDRRPAGATSPTSGRSIPTGPTRAGSATCPASSRRWRRSGSGRRASSGSRRRRRAAGRRSSTPAGSSPGRARARGSAVDAPHGWAIPAALLAAAVLYLLARALGTVYTSAKALAIAAPLIALVILGGLLGSDRRRRFACSRVAFGLAAAALELSDPAPGAGGAARPHGRARQIRPLVAGREAALPRPGQLRPLRAPRVEAVHPCRTSTTRTSSSPTRARGRVREVRLRRGRRRDAGAFPLRAHDPRRLRQRAAAGVSSRPGDAVLRALETRRSGR